MGGREGEGGDCGGGVVVVVGGGRWEEGALSVDWTGSMAVFGCV